jgi:2-polyprenyl-6-methoxyphenol hydroxylase-like FAD-dependent oxidoreductase
VPDPDLNVVIIGAGVGGLCLAQGLRQAGIPVRVYERDQAPDARLQGYRLNIEPMGSRALHDCLPGHLWDLLVRTAGDPGPGMNVLTQRMRLLMREPGESRADPADGAHAVSRATLRRVLQAGLDEVHFGKEFTRYEQDGGNIALCDARDLCQALRQAQPGQVRAAVAEYERQMLPRGFGAVSASRRYLHLAISRNPALRLTALGFFRLCGAIGPLRRAVFAD